MVKLQLPSLIFVRDSNYNTFREKIVNFACLTYKIHTTCKLTQKYHTQTIKCKIQVKC